MSQDTVIIEPRFNGPPDIEGEVLAGEPHMITAWFIGEEGRKRYAGSALYTADGKRLAIAKATWIELALPT